MAEVLEEAGRDHEPTRKLAARLRSMAPGMNETADNVAVEACNRMAQEFLAGAKRFEELLSQK